ncbi:MAG: sugar phosphorylase [Anaerolineales bacterium]|nr:sugar phosphorylase [Anaerolineales bacterium]
MLTINKLRDSLLFLYGEHAAAPTLERTLCLLDEYRPRIRPRRAELNERDSLLITYGDQVQASDEIPLQTLKKFCDLHLREIVGGIHILPFYPWTSDDGFSVVDYRRVDPALGNWDDISALENFRLMFDGVINHVSSQSEWFQKFLQDDSRYKDYFIVVEGDPDLSQVVRPRALPLLTPFQTPTGIKKVWTTFSADQVDLNFKNPDVLLDVLDALLFYAERGADFIRLDAIAYLWKEIGSRCIHLPQTHAAIQFFRAALSEVAPHVQFITETNVPHRDNISYFGDGTNEAQLIYNFALPPLTLNAFRTGDARTLSNWAQTLTPPSRQTTFFNFLASHDGIGLNPARGILSNAEIDSLVENALAHGGFISHKQNADGTQSPYEMNVNYFDALSNPNGGEPLTLQVARFIASQAIMLSLIGVPGIYFHSLFGSRGWREGAIQSGHHRAVNREKLRFDELQNQLADSTSLRYQVFSQYSRLLKMRGASSAFHPHGTQIIHDAHPSVFSVERVSPSGERRMICLHNVSAQKVSFALNQKSFALAPYQVLWLSLDGVKNNETEDRFKR